MLPWLSPHTFVPPITCTIASYQPDFASIKPRRSVRELKREEGLQPIFSPTKLKVRQDSFVCLFVCSASCLSASLSACLPIFLPVLSSHFLYSPPFRFFFLGDLQSDATPWPPFPDAPGTMTPIHIDTKWISPLYFIFSSWILTPLYFLFSSWILTFTLMVFGQRPR